MVIQGCFGLNPGRKSSISVKEIENSSTLDEFTCFHFFNFYDRLYFESSNYGVPKLVSC